MMRIRPVRMISWAGNYLSCKPITSLPDSLLKDWLGVYGNVIDKSLVDDRLDSDTEIPYGAAAGAC